MTRSVSRRPPVTASRLRLTCPSLGAGSTANNAVLAPPTPWRILDGIAVGFVGWSAMLAAATVKGYIEDIPLVVVDQTGRNRCRLCAGELNFGADVDWAHILGLLCPCSLNRLVGRELDDSPGGDLPLDDRLVLALPVHGGVSEGRLRLVLFPDPLGRRLRRLITSSRRAWFTAQRPLLLPRRARETLDRRRDSAFPTM